VVWLVLDAEVEDCCADEEVDAVVLVGFDVDKVTLFVTGGGPPTQT
jgi:hypothetical protein